jgi:molybdopterin synthase sulfur carrier subunit
VPVQVRIPTMMRQDTGGQASVEASGATIGEVLDDLVRRFPAMAAKLRNPDGTLHRFVNVYVNDEDVRYLDKLDTVVSDGDEVSIVPAVAGGS